MSGQAGRPEPTPGVKMHYLIRRRAETSREELICHWFANHMPAVIASQHAAAEKGKLHARRYVATLFERFEQLVECPEPAWKDDQGAGAHHQMQLA